MSASRPGANSRRSFLKSLPAAVAGTAAAPVLARAQAPASLSAISADDLGVAQQIVGVNLPPSERESARPIVQRNRENIELIRRVAVASETEPAFTFRPSTRLGAGPTRSISKPASRAAARTGRLGAPRVSPPATLDALAFEPVTVVAQLIQSRQISSTELTRMYLDRLKRHDRRLFCVITLLEERALAEAAAADREIRAGQYRGPLHGVPYGIKDLFAVNRVPTTWVRSRTRSRSSTMTPPRSRGCATRAPCSSPSSRLASSPSAICGLQAVRATHGIRSAGRADHRRAQHRQQLPASSGLLSAPKPLVRSSDRRAAAGSLGCGRPTGA
jgi:hypothetical protein